MHLAYNEPTKLRSLPLNKDCRKTKIYLHYVRAAIADQAANYRCSMAVAGLLFVVRLQIISHGGQRIPLGYDHDRARGICSNQERRGRYEAGEEVKYCRIYLGGAAHSAIYIHM